MTKDNQSCKEYMVVKILFMSLYIAQQEYAFETIAVILFRIHIQPGSTPFQSKT